MRQYQNSSTGRSVVVPPGSALPTGPGLWQPIGGAGGPLQGGQLVPTDAAAGSGAGSGPPFLNSYQFRMLALGFLIGFGIVYVPFFIRGNGFYSWYPAEMGMKLGVAVGGIFCAVALLRGVHLIKAGFVLALSWTIYTFLIPSVPVLDLLKHLY